MRKSDAVRVLLAALGVALMIVAPAQAGPRAVVELFTSQGCSSCPPADRLMAQWAKDDDLVAISFPVDYWDYLGWRDTLAQHAFTLRQQDYAHLRGDRDVYTPQVVVNGLRHAVGSQADAIEAAMAATAGTLTVPIAIANSLDGYIVSVGPGGEAADIVLVPIRVSARVAIGRGENTGTSVVYSNVACGLSTIGAYGGQRMTLTLTPGQIGRSGSDAFAILVQKRVEGRPGAIIGAALLRR